MGELVLYLVIASFVSPIFSAVGILSFFKNLDIRIYKISVFFTYVSLVCSLLAMILFFRNDGLDLYYFKNTFYSLYITPLSIILIFFVSAISLVIHLYSTRYMYDEEGYARYFILLDLMIAVIFGLAIVNNLMIMATFWHMMGVILYFLLVHNFRKKQTYKYAFYTFFTHLLADIPFLLAIYLIYNYYSTLDLKFFLETAIGAKSLYFAGTNISVISLIALFIMFSAIIKSAQFPFHMWLPFTLEGPNPVSALMHAGIVNAGAFIVNRFAPVFLHGTIALHVALVVGFITAILGSSLMLMQNDIKKALAYSTVGQMGYMMLEIGSGAFALAIYHMMVHGIFKASLFLGSGGIINEARNMPNISKKSTFDFFFSKIKYKNPSIFEYIIFVIFIPLLVSFLIFSPLIKENSYDSTMLFYLFAWVSGAQVIYTMYHMQKRFISLFLSTVGFASMLFVYIFAEHLSSGLLYPNRELFDGLFKAASWSDALFFMIYGVISAIVVLVWVFAYQKLVHHKSIYTKFEDLYDFIYRIFGREFYILDACSTLSNKLIKISKTINNRIKY
jgi:NADH-quinone oxidoreductase subunit L